MMLGPMCAYNEEVDPARYGRAAVALGADGARFSQSVERLCSDLGLTGRLRDYGVVPDDYDRIVGLALKSDNVLANPRPAGASELKDLLTRAQ